jgi:hypothetical protein
MSDQPQPRRRRFGIAAVAVIVVLIIVDLIVIGVVLSEARGHDVTVQRLETVRAYYAAEAGMHMAMRELQLQDNLDDDCSIGTISNDGIDANDPALGTASFMVTATPSGSQYTIRSYGRSGDARREMSALVDVSSGAGEVAYDTTTAPAVIFSGSTAYTHSIGGEADRILIVTVSAYSWVDGNWDVTGVTYDGVPMTKAVEHFIKETPGLDLWTNHEIWYMLEADLPAAGMHLVAVTMGGPSGFAISSATSISGAAQQGPEATATGEFWGGFGITTDITTLTDGAWVFESVGQRTGGATYNPQAGQTVRQAQFGLHSAAHGTDEIPTAGTTAQGWTSSNPEPLVHVLAAFAPK